MSASDRASRYIAAKKRFYEAEFVYLRSTTKETELELLNAMAEFMYQQKNARAYVESCILMRSYIELCEKDNQV